MPAEGPHFYRGLDDSAYNDGAMRLSLSLREVAVKIEHMNYGVHRFLSHLIDVRREELKMRIEGYKMLGDDDVAASVERRGDPLVDGIERLLNDGLT